MNRSPFPRLELSRKRVVATTAVAVIVAALVVQVLNGSAERNESAAAEATAEISRRDLTATVTATGRLEHGDTRAVYWQQPAPVAQTMPSADSGSPDGGAAQQEGAAADGETAVHTVTSLAAAGQGLNAGDVLYGIDGQPTVLMLGAEAAYRDLHEGVEDGPDVTQLEQNLTALGFTDDGALVIDEHFGAATTAAVADWQESLGVEATGTVALGGVNFLPDPVTVAATDAAIGDAVDPGAHLLDVTAETLLAMGDVSVRSLGDIAEGNAATVTLADGTSVAGTVLDVGDHATRPADTPVGDSTVEVTVQVDATDSAAAVELADVTLAVTVATRSNVLTVPVAAIVDGGDGRTAVRLPTDGGDASEAGEGTGQELVAFDPGLSAAGYVEVVDDSLPEGTSVLLPGDR